MNQHLDLSHRHIEQPAGLDHLEPFIEERCRIYGDFLAHLPRRMSQGLRLGDIVEPVGRQSPEWTARRSQNQIFYLLAPFPFQTLKNCVVLAVDR